MIPVALGVYLAVAATNWQEERKLEHSLSQIDSAIRSEIELNKKSLEITYAYHTALSDSLTAFAARTTEGQMASSKNLGDLFKYFRGTRMGKLNHGAYQAALASGIMTEVGVDRLTTLSNIYNEQENYDRLGDNYLGWVSRLSSQSTQMDAFLFMQSMSNDAKFAEQRMINLMDQALAE